MKMGKNYPARMTGTYFLWFAIFTALLRTVISICFVTSRCGSAVTYSRHIHRTWRVLFCLPSEQNFIKTTGRCPGNIQHSVRCTGAIVASIALLFGDFFVALRNDSCSLSIGVLCSCQRLTCQYFFFSNFTFRNFFKMNTPCFLMQYKIVKINIIKLNSVHFITFI